MYHLHLTRTLRSLAFFAVLGAVMLGAVSLWWVNHTGLPQSWRDAIEKEIAKQGAFVRIGSLSYMPFQGVTASDVAWFSDNTCQHEISRIESVLLDFDKSRLARRELRIQKIELKNARLILPVDPADPESSALQVSRVNGTLLMPGNRRLEVREAKGRIEGIEVSLDARVIGYQQESTAPKTTQQTSRRRVFLAHLLGELKKWHFDPTHPPSIRVFLEGNVNDSRSLNVKFSVAANQLEKNHHEIRKLAIQAGIAGDLLTVTSFIAKDSRGSLEAHMDYDFSEREGRFHLNSGVEIPTLLNAWLNVTIPNPVIIGGNQTVKASGEFRLPAGERPILKMTGTMGCDSVMLRGVAFDRLQSDFAWNQGSLFLRNVKLLRPDGEASGKVMIQWPKVRMALESTFPPVIYRPFFVGQPLEKVIDDFTARNQAHCRVKLEGGFDATDPHSWAYTGGGKVQNMSYKGVPFNSAECQFDLSHYALDFHSGTVVFDYRNYPLRQAYDGPSEATVKVGRIRYDAEPKTVLVENVVGSIWAAPLVRFFAPKVADSLEIYRFHRPPALRGDGIVDVTPKGRTALDISFQSAAAADYPFLGETITLAQPAGNVRIRGSRVLVENLVASGFDGPIKANFDAQEDGKLTGEMSWTRLAIPALASTYGFDVKNGTITGRIQFTMHHGNVRTMNGEGLFALEETELFSVPMFGPLSQLIGTLIKDERMGFEHAKNAFCTFTIRDGMLATQDFQTASKSLTFHGEGAVNMAENTLEMTMRVNAQGLLGLITLPLKPFYGMFEFRGSGPLKKPKWENVMTAPTTTPSIQSPDVPKATQVEE